MIAYVTNGLMPSANGGIYFLWPTAQLAKSAAHRRRASTHRGVVKFGWRLRLVFISIAPTWPSTIVRSSRDFADGHEWCSPTRTGRFNRTLMAGCFRRSFTAKGRMRSGAC